MAVKGSSTVWDVRAGESLEFASAGIRITLVHKSGRLARLHVVAPHDTRITIDKSSEDRAGLRGKHETIPA
ncbi:hypothetical protein [Roseateles sp.]|uniref:hypothetical protein n=1 Tax=Roseateles sp. TaxID=1971397 RepID=UPI002DFB7A12|nr:hypothetical protein [Roseateles sp.]